MLCHRSGEHYPISFVTLQPRDLIHMKKVDGWQRGFNWSTYFKLPSVEIYKLMVLGSNQVQGAIALEIQTGYVEIHLVESAPSNRGEEREFYDVGPTIFAFACNRSIEIGGEGFVSFTAKSGLIDHYRHSLGAKQMTPNSLRMVIDDVAAKHLIEVYLS